MANMTEEWAKYAYLRWYISTGVLLSLQLSCGTSDIRGSSEGAHCEYTWECDEGLVCADELCTTPVPSPPEPDDPSVTPGGNDPTTPNPPDPDLPPDPDDPPDPESPNPVLSGANYRICTSDLDCAVFSGNCIIDLHLSRPELDGRTSVPLHTLMPEHLEQGEGVCSDTCTNDPRVCDSLRASNSDGHSAPYTCQLLYAGLNPYDAATGAENLDLNAMARGVAFASLCRPPLGYTAEYSDTFCAPCSDDDACDEEERCFIESPYNDSPKGSCVMPCTGHDACPAGFECESIDASDAQERYCIPIAETCGPCLDKDGDQRGIGRCGPVDAPITDVDCDDTDPQIYFDALYPNHAFPDYCGTEDKNCNHIPDDVEQRGSAAHCNACNDLCDPNLSPIANGRLSCESVDKEQEIYTCEAQCRAGYADCDDEPGCETQLSDDYRWFLDEDGDGFGTNATVKYFCPGNEPSKGWSQLGGDCDDSNPDVYPGAHELCDGLDNNCNGEIDDDVYNTETGDPALNQPCLIEDLDGVCAEGTMLCEFTKNSRNEMIGEKVCNSPLDPGEQRLVEEQCNCQDDNCNGLIDDNVEAWGSCVVPGAVGVCAEGELICGDCNVLVDADGNPLLDKYGRPKLESTEVCAAKAAPSSEPDRYGDGKDTNCDGIDGDAENAIFVDGRDGNDDEDGSMSHPVNTLQRALTLACGAAGPCKDIFATGGEQPGYVSDEPLRIPTFENATNEQSIVYDETTETWSTGVQPMVRIYGGFSINYDNCTYEHCVPVWEKSTDERTVVLRTIPSNHDAQDLNQNYAAIEPLSETGRISLALEDIDIVLDAAPTNTADIDGTYHGANYIGLRCGSHNGATCAFLSFRGVSIRLPAGQDGATFNDAPREAADTTEAMNGKDGCYSVVGPQDGDHGYDCHDVDDTRGDDKPFASYESRGKLTRNPFKGINSTCDSSRTKGGEPTLARIWQDGHHVPANRETGNAYSFDDLENYNSKDGLQIAGFKKKGSSTSSSVNHSPRSNAHGDNGQRGSYTRASSPYVRANGISHRYTQDEQPTDGVDGFGGGGGAGCLRGKYKVDDEEFEITDCSIERDRVGGGGGAGGCAGGSSYNGGHGSSLVGIAIAPGTSEDTMTRVELHPLHLRENTFQIYMNRAGVGGRGGAGHDGQFGGSGGLGNPGSGGNGGRGGHGGGGAGGDGGDAIGIAIQCPAGSNCDIQMPAHLRTAIRAYLQNFPTAPAMGGSGGQSKGNRGLDGQNGRLEPIKYFN